MTRTPPNTPSGDRRRDRAVRRARVAQPLEGNRIRVRAKQLDQVDVEKLTLAYWLLSKELVSDRTDGRDLPEADVHAAARSLDGESMDTGNNGQADGAEVDS